MMRYPQEVPPTASAPLHLLLPGWGWWGRPGLLRGGTLSLLLPRTEHLPVVGILQIQLCFCL